MSELNEIPGQAETQISELENQHVEVSEPTATPEQPEQIPASSDVSEVKFEGEEAMHPDFHAEEEVEDHDEVTDYERMSIDELAALSNEFAAQDPSAKADNFFNIAKEIFDEHDRNRREELLKKFLAENPDSRESDFDYQKTPHAILFYGNFQRYRENKVKFRQRLQKEQAENLAVKKQIIEELKALTEHMDDQSGSLEKIRELQKRWKAVGQVPANERENLNMTYRALIERFYDLKDQENELKELDRKRNLEEKIKLCEKVEALISMENINQAAAILNKLHEEFREIGPVPKEAREEIWLRFKAASDAIYNRKRQFAEEYKKQLQENMLKKQQLCLEIEQFLSFTSDKIKDWNAKTKEILALQDRWNQIGAIPKEVSKDINKQFWSNFKAFFSNKAKFFDEIESARLENLKRKEQLCLRAEELADGNEWDKITEELKRLQEEWKKIGPVPEKDREPIYNRFKTAVDRFFERKRNRRNEKDREFEENLAQKQAVIKSIKELATVEGDTLPQFIELKDKFFSIGFVPTKHKNRISDQFLAAVDEYFESGKLSSPNKEKTWLSVQKELAEKFPFAAKKMQEKEQAIRRKIAAIENDIALWENNLSFFSNSKTADRLRSEFEGKIKSSRERLEVLKAQLKALRSA